jgi:hypothetical protein
MWLLAEMSPSFLAAMLFYAHGQVISASFYVYLMILRAAMASLRRRASLKNVVFPRRGEVRSTDKSYTGTIGIRVKLLI